MSMAGARSIVATSLVRQATASSHGDDSLNRNERGALFEYVLSFDQQHDRSTVTSGVHVCGH
eukprot:m.435700 g.435700  ORF g.435700 m.435700 type:complete len:62 (-) comp103327_c0_seq1:379-564(-)